MLDQLRREIADWLSPLNFMSHQNDAYSRRQEGTGQWLLESDSFKEWTTGCEKFLWCPGIRQSFLFTLQTHSSASNMFCVKFPSRRVLSEVLPLANTPQHVLLSWILLTLR